MVGAAESVNPILKRFVEAICEKWRVNKVYLFGSYASGRFTADSDIDVAVISPDVTSRLDARIEMYKVTAKVSRLFEPLAYRPEDFDEATPADFCYEIKRTGVVIYDEQQGGMLI